jgi:hypothetical protein
MGAAMKNDDLSQADLSHLRVQDMTDAQRAELRRRFEDFVTRVVKRPLPGAAGTPPKRAEKWVPPGAKRR